MMTTSRRGGGSAFDDAISRPLLNTASSGNQSNVSQRQYPPKPSSLSQSQQYHQPAPVAPPASMFQQPHHQFGRAAATSQYKPPNPSRERAHQQEQLQQQVLLLEEQELRGGDLEEALLRERHGEFVNIHGNMQQINDIYKDLAHVVDAQQDHIDEMEMNILNTEQSAEEGMHQLNKVAGMTISQHVGERTLRLGSGIFVSVAFVMLVYMLLR